jgi:hypothetical protein
MDKRDEPRLERQAFIPPMPKDFIVTFRGKERPWLGRIVGSVLAPIFRWRQLRALRKRRPPAG